MYEIYFTYKNKRININYNIKEIKKYVINKNRINYKNKY